MDVYLNGRMVPHDQAAITVHDAGLQHAVGLFETMTARHGRAFRLDRHLGRLAHSAQTLGLVRELDTAALTNAVQTTLAHNKLDSARIRLTLTPGSLSLLKNPAAAQDQPQPTVLVVPSPPTTYDPSYFDRGIMVLVAPPYANPFDPLASHKTLAYWGRLRILRQAASAGAGEALILNITNHLAGGCVSNIFLVKDSTLLTPFARGEEIQGALPAPVLPGITRAAVIELAPGLGLSVERKMLAATDLLDADEAFLTNSSWQALPLTRVEQKTIGSGAVGPITQRVRQTLLDLIEEETSHAPG